MKPSMVLFVLVAYLLASSAYGKRGKRQPCGRQFSDARIVGGEEAPKGDWPWQVQLRTTDTDFAFCGGTLVEEQWVVTAAHCTSIFNAASEFYVRLGAHKRDDLVGTEQNITVEKIFNHKKYNRKTPLTHDISMLKLSTPANLNRDVNLACLPKSKKYVEQGTKCWVTGFGTLKSGGDIDDTKVLMQVEVPIVSHKLCKYKYKQLGYKVDKTMMCAGEEEGGKDSCQGDSGGPMVCESKGKYYLEGVVSWGLGCAEKGKYGVYANIRYLYRKWIAKIMRKN